MRRKLRLVYLAHSLRSDWNNGNAHFLRGLMRALVQLGHDVTIYEPGRDWSLENLETEASGYESLRQFEMIYPELNICTYSMSDSEDEWLKRLDATDAVILHEWNPAELAWTLLKLRDRAGYKLLFHDTHHRASSSPEQIQKFGLDRFDGILAFGESLRRIYRERFALENVWVLHEAADVTVFHPYPEIAPDDSLVWIGNWGDGERSKEICEFLLKPAAALRDRVTTTIYGVRYPEDGLNALRNAGISYGGYLPNLASPQIYAAAKVTVHIPRQQYNGAMQGIPTIRVFEALACGIPLVSAPWVDCEGLFNPGDFVWATDSQEMVKAIQTLICDRSFAEHQTAQGLQAILSRHTCRHRADELTAVLEEVLA